MIRANGSGSLMLANLGTVTTTLEAAHIAETAGFRRVWLAEAAGPNALVSAGLIARETSLEVGTAIVSAYTRTPALLAMSAADLATLSGTRPFHLGIGPSGPIVVEQWNGLAFERPLSHVRDMLAVVRQALSGQRTNYSGTAYSSHGYQLLPLSPQAEIRLHVGGVGLGMVRLAAQQADGLIVAYSSPEMFGAKVQALREALAQADRQREDVNAAAIAYIAVTDHPDEVRERLRQQLVPFTNRVTAPGYARHFSAGGFAHMVDQVSVAMASSDRATAAAAISDNFLDGLVIATKSMDEIEARVNEYAEAGADEVILAPIPPPAGADFNAVIETIQALGQMPQLKGQRT
jgi:probable F420-dependent oxidoreductase